MPSEASFTPPSQWCPHPERWTAANTDATENEVADLVAALVRALQPDLVIETGCHIGVSAERIGRVLASNGQGRLLTCDIDVAAVNTTRNRCLGLPVDVEHCAGMDLKPLDPVGLLWLDSDLHTRHRELEHLAPFLAPGALVAVHDVGPQHPVHTYLDRGRVPLVGVRLRTPRGIGLYQLADQP